MGNSPPVRDTSTPLDDLVSIALFAHVVETRSFSLAARRVGMSKSMVSKRIARLEAHFGAALLTRTTRKVALTEAGSALFEHASRILREAEQAGARISESSGEIRGTLRVATGISLGQEHLARLIPELLALHPALRVELVLDDRMNDLVAEGLDVAVRIGGPDVSGLLSRRLGSTALLTVASPSYLARAGAPSHPRELAAHECIRYSNLSAAEEWRFAAGKQARSFAVGGRMVANHGIAIREACVAGLGIARLPDFTIRGELARGALIEVLASYTLPPHVVAAVYPRRRIVPRAVRAFVDFLAARLEWRAPARAAVPQNP